MATTASVSNLSNLSIDIPGHVLFQQLEDEAVILDVQSGGYFGLNEVGTFVWQQLAAGQEVPGIVRAMRDHYEVDEARASADVTVFLSALQEQGLVILHP